MQIWSFPRSSPLSYGHRCITEDPSGPFLSNSLITLHCAHCLHHALCVSFCHHPALSSSGLCYPLHQESSKNNMGLSKSNLLANCQSKLSWILPAFSFALHPFSWVWNCTMLCSSSPFCASAICSASLTFLTRIVPIVRMLMAICSLNLLPSLRFFPDWSTPVKLCSIQRQFACVLITVFTRN